MPLYNFILLFFSLLFGNIYSYFVLKGSANITSGERTKLYTALSGAAVAGTLCFLILRNKRTSDVNDLVNLPKSAESSDPSLNTESSLNIEYVMLWIKLFSWVLIFVD